MSGTEQRTARAFTLIELLIVVAIIAILAAIAVPNFLEAQVRSKVARAKSEMRMLDVALTAYHVDQMDYPPWTRTLIGGDRPGGEQPTAWRLHRLTTPVAYITKVPKDQFTVGREWDQWITWDGVRVHIWDGYDYINFVPPGSPGATDHLSLWGHWWRLESIGPDNVSQWGGGRSSWQGTPLSGYNRFPDYIYDPTNGTVSWGDIVRVGPRAYQSKTPYHPIEQLPW